MVIMIDYVAKLSLPGHPDVKYLLLIAFDFDATRQDGSVKPFHWKHTPSIFHKVKKYETFIFTESFPPCVAVTVQSQSLCVNLNVSHASCKFA